MRNPPGRYQPAMSSHLIHLFPFEPFPTQADLQIAGQRPFGPGRPPYSASGNHVDGARQHRHMPSWFFKMVRAVYPIRGYLNDAKQCHSNEVIETRSSNLKYTFTASNIIDHDTGLTGDNQPLTGFAFFFGRYVLWDC